MSAVGNLESEVTSRIQKLQEKYDRKCDQEITGIERRYDQKVSELERKYGVSEPSNDIKINDGLEIEGRAHEDGTEHNYDNDILEADLLYGTSGEDSLEGLIDRLESREKPSGNKNYNVKKISGDDIRKNSGEIYIRDTPAKELEGTDMIWRRAKNGFYSKDEERDGEIVEKLDALEEEGLNLMPLPHAGRWCDSKKQTNRILDQYGISNVDNYKTEDEVREQLAQGEKVVSKPDRGTHGRGFEILDPNGMNISDFEFDENRVYEEMVDHWDDPFVEERRALVVAGPSGSRVVQVKNRGTDSEDHVPKNYSDGGFYRDLDYEDSPLLLDEVNEVARMAEPFQGVLGVDYTVDLEEGETKNIEVNSTVGYTGISEASDVDVYDVTAEAVADIIEDRMGFREYADHLGDVINPELEKRRVAPEIEN